MLSSTPTHAFLSTRRLHRSTTFSPFFSFLHTTFPVRPPTVNCQRINRSIVNFNTCTVFLFIFFCPFLLFFLFVSISSHKQLKANQSWGGRVKVSRHCVTPSLCYPTLPLQIFSMSVALQERLKFVGTVHVRPSNWRAASHIPTNSWPF